MSDLERLILQAWEKHQQRICSNPHELQKRLARRTPTLMRPPRAWCLTLRASDRRITAMDWIITPEHALDLNHPDHPYEPIEHTVTIQPHGLRKFCRPVRTDSWGEQVHKVARDLGSSPRAIHRARLAGLFTERFVKGLGGKWGKPIPLIHSWTTLDPSGTGHFARPDPLWGSLWEFLPDMIPDDFEQTITRRPRFRQFSRHCDGQLTGWRWLCPACKKEVTKIYYPLPVYTLFDYLGYDPACSHVPRPTSHVRSDFLPYDLHHLDPPPPTFACKHCHRIRYFTTTNHNGWNDIISHLTRGLLYGHEVEKPHWYKTKRQRARTRQLHRPSPKRDAIYEHLQLGHTITQIALDLLISTNAVACAIRLICLQHGVKTRRQLAQKLAWKTPQPDTLRQQIRDRAKARDQQIEQLLLQDLTYEQIATRLRITFAYLDRAVQRLYKRHNLPRRAGRKALAQKLGANLPGRHARSAEFRQRLFAGQSDREIAEAMNLTLIAVGSRIKKMIKKEGVRGRKGLFEKYSTLVGAASAAV